MTNINLQLHSPITDRTIIMTMDVMGMKITRVYLWMIILSSPNGNILAGNHYDFAIWW